MSFGNRNINDLNLKIEELTKQKDQAYAERNKVVAALAHILNKTLRVVVAKHQGEDWEDDWRTVLVIYLPSGRQITWHFHDSELSLLKGLPELKSYQWDGHTTEEKYQRLFNFLKEGEIWVGGL